MIVTPYTRPPAPPRVAVMFDAGRVISEDGELLDLERLEPGTRVWASWDTVHRLVGDGIGEALCWQGEEIRWRARVLEEADWTRRASDVAVIRLPFPEDEQLVLRAFASWRNWLAGYGAAPTGTTGSSAWSLLRATLRKRLWCSFGASPPLRQTLGGRQELGPRGAGRYEGWLEHVDLPAAYASELGGLEYGGTWFDAASLPQQDPAWWASSGRAVFVRAKVRVARDVIGPLPRRLRTPSRAVSVAIGAEYPTGCRLQGVWTWPELETAEALSTISIEKVLQTWVHIADGHPFRAWWQAIEQGRRMGGFAALLAKSTGNALWGRFCMDIRLNQQARSVRSRKGRRLVSRVLPDRAAPPAAHDLAETVSGRTRARLYALMSTAGSQLVSAHTDGAWLEPGPEYPNYVPEPWRVKEHARRLDLLDPQVLRYWPAPARPTEPWVVFAGVPAGSADAAFATAWEQAGFAS